MTNSDVYSAFARGSSVRIDVRYYDKANQELLLKYAAAPRIEEAVRNGIDVPLGQLLTYYLFYRKRASAVEFRTYRDLDKKIGLAMSELEGWIRYSNGSLVAQAEAAPQDKAVTERLGEGCALSVVSWLHDLHEADWEKIPDRARLKVFDYQHQVATASDETSIIQVEAKGSAVDDPAQIDDRIRANKARIDRKKTDIKGREQAGEYPFPADMRYGCIAAIGRIGNLTCWLTDPPSNSTDAPRRHRLMARMRFICKWVSMLSGNSPFAACLESRYRALCALEDPFVLDRVGLVRANGEPFKFPRGHGADRRQGIFARLCRVVDGPAVGRLVGSPRDGLYFIGLQRELYDLAARQDFTRLLQYKNSPGVVPKHIICVVSRRRAGQLGLEANSPGTRGERRGYVQFESAAPLYFGQSGIVFGRLVNSQGGGPVSQYAIDSRA